MITLNVRHTTTYRYTEPVSLGPHRLMLRPRESRELCLRSMELIVEPRATLSWAHDVAGNVVATAVFGSMADSVMIQANMTVELAATPWPVFAVAASALTYPFRYGDDEALDLGALTQPQYYDPAGHLRDWVRGFVLANPTDTLALLKDINAGVLASVSYQSREAEGTQSPRQSLERSRGSCRDLAILFIEAVRTLGFGARVVSGYLHDPAQHLVGSSGAGSTHAWAEVYVPGAGWIAFDPTNRSVGGVNLIPVAVGRDIRQVTPVAGNYIGTRNICAGMSVGVSISS